MMSELTKGIVIGLVTSVGTAIIMFLFASTGGYLKSAINEEQVIDAATELITDPSKRTVLINYMADDLNNRFKGEKGEPPSTNEVVSSILDDERFKTLVDEAVSIPEFGTWSRRNVNEIYEAETDGFVAITSGSANSTNAGGIEVGSNVNNIIMRARFWSTYDTAFTAVSKGELWRAVNYAEVPTQKTGFSVKWLSFGVRN